MSLHSTLGGIVIAVSLWRAFLSYCVSVYKLVLDSECIT